MTPTPVKKYVARRVHLEEIETDIRTRISSGIWRPGTMIPSRRDLARDYGVDLNVIQRAIYSLIADKTLITGLGRGTFVAESANTASRIHAVTSGRSLASGPDLNIDNIEVTIGVVATLWSADETLKDPHDNWPAAMLRAFEWSTAAMPNATIKFRNTDSRHGDVGDAMIARAKELIADGVDALALIMPSAECLVEAEAIAERCGIPVVVIHDGSRQETSLPMVCYDSEFAGFQAGQHLIQRGYENVSFFCPLSGAPWAEKRRDGVVSALRKAGRSLLDVPFSGHGRLPNATDCNHRNVAREVAERYLASGFDSWGIVAANDNLAYGLLDIAQSLGLEVGRDFGLIGFDDLSPSRVLDVTSLHPPLDAMGAEAAKLLHNILGGNRTTTEVRLRSHLIARSSTKPVRAVSLRQAETPSQE